MSAYPGARWVWFDGRLVRREDVRIDPLCHGLHYGTGVFEGLRSYATSEGTGVFRLREHLERLRSSALALGTPLPYGTDELVGAVEAVLRANELADAYVRPLAFLDASGLGLDTRRHGYHTLIAAWSWGPYLGASGLVRGIRLATASRRKTSGTMVPVRSKVCGNYVNSVLALRESLDRGSEEGLLLDARGGVTEGTGENLFVVRNEELWTPSRSGDLLPGITRDSVLSLARALALRCRERRLFLNDLRKADEIFLTGTAAEITPVASWDGRPPAKGSPGPVTRRLQSAFSAAVRRAGPLRPVWDGWHHLLRSGAGSEAGGPG